MRRPFALASAAGLAATGVFALATPPAAGAATSCSAVDVSFARGTGESPGLGITGTPFVNSLSSDLSAKNRNVTSYAVNYSASYDQTSAGPGSTDLVNHLRSVAATCPSTQFVIGGYSQGATVIDNAVGLRTPSSYTGTVIPSGLASRVKAVVVFGNPLGLQGETIEANSPTYGPKAKSFCNFGDPVCGAGYDPSAHLTYGTNGSTSTGAQFAAAKIT